MKKKLFFFRQVPTAVIPNFRLQEIYSLVGMSGCLQVFTHRHILPTNTDDLHMDMSMSACSPTLFPYVLATRILPMNKIDSFKHNPFCRKNIQEMIGEITRYIVGLSACTKFLFFSPKMYDPGVTGQQPFFSVLKPDFILFWNPQRGLGPRCPKASQGLKFFGNQTLLYPIYVII